MTFVRIPMITDPLIGSGTTSNTPSGDVTVLGDDSDATYIDYTVGGSTRTKVPLVNRPDFTPSPVGPPLVELHFKAACQNPGASDMTAYLVWIVDGYACASTRFVVPADGTVVDQTYDFGSQMYHRLPPSSGPYVNSEWNKGAGDSGLSGSLERPDWTEFWMHFINPTDFPGTNSSNLYLNTYSPASGQVLRVFQLSLDYEAPTFGRLRVLADPEAGSEDDRWQFMASTNVDNGGVGVGKIVMPDGTFRAVQPEPGDVGRLRVLVDPEAPTLEERWKFA